MDHVVLFFYMIVLTVAGAGAVVSVILHLRIRHRITRDAMAVTLLFLVSLVMAVTSYYTRVVLRVPPGTSLLQSISGVVLAAAIYAGVTDLLCAAAPKGRTAHVLAGVAVIAVQVGRAIIYVAASPRAMAAIRLPAIGLISLFLLYVGIVMKRASAHHASATVSSLLARLGVLLIVFGPTSAGLYALLDQIPAEIRPYLSFDFLFALGWSAILISAFLRYLGKPETALGEQGVPDGFLRAYKITPREADVIGLVAKGLSNKEIAAELYVSLATVRTHLYNVFQKTGATSRVNLLRLVTSFRE